MATKTAENRSVVMALIKAYAPENCPKKYSRGKCKKCSQINKCDKDFAFKAQSVRLAAIGNANIELAKKKEAFVINMSKAADKTPPPPEAPTKPEAFTAAADSLAITDIAPAAQEAAPEAPKAAEQAAPGPEAPAAQEAAPEAAEAAPQAAQKRVVSPVKFWR